MDSDRGSYQVERAIATDGGALQKRRFDEDLDLQYKETDPRASVGALGNGSGTEKPNGILKKPHGAQSSSSAKPLIKSGTRSAPRGDARTPLASAGTEWYV